MRGKIRAADAEIDNIFPLPVQLLDLPQLLRKIIFPDAM
jgi:hypothetical protein